MRLEKGDEGVSIGTLPMACLVLGEIDRLGKPVDPASDDTGLLLDCSMLSKRIQSGRRKASARSAVAGRGTSDRDPSDDDGIGL